tara:strand:+ start:309 stop:533 length:225 start_codon:yes stop_codon:yes gene_type:complete
MEETVKTWAIEFAPNWKPFVRVAIYMLTPSKAKRLVKSVESGTKIILDLADQMDAIINLPEGDYHIKRGKITKL